MSRRRRHVGKIRRVVGRRGLHPGVVGRRRQILRTILNAGARRVGDRNRDVERAASFHHHQEHHQQQRQAKRQLHYVYEIAPKDGTVIAAVQRPIPFQTLFGDAGVRFDVRKLIIRPGQSP